MSNLNGDAGDNKLLAAVALALIDYPGASLQELARAIGVSKATLYRFCRTREELIDRVFKHCMHVFREAIGAAQLEVAPVKEALRHLISHFLEHKELTAFLIYYWKDAAKDPSIEAAWEAVMDAFFLRGQREGIFRVDIPAPALTEIWGSVIVGLADAERRGRVARAGLTGLIESALMKGVAA